MKAYQLLAIALLSAALAGPALAQNAAPAATMPETTMAKPASMFVAGTAMSGLWTSSDVIGQAVYNKANERLGDIEQLLIDHDGKVTAAVVGVGGFLGLGETKVAIAYPYFEMMRDKDGKARLVVDVNKDVLKNAPAFKTADIMKRS